MVNYAILNNRLNQCKYIQYMSWNTLYKNEHCTSVSTLLKCWLEEDKGGARCLHWDAWGDLSLQVRLLFSMGCLWCLLGVWAVSSPLSEQLLEMEAQRKSVFKAQLHHYSRVTPHILNTFLLTESDDFCMIDRPTCTGVIVGSKYKYVTTWKIMYVFIYIHKCSQGGAVYIMSLLTQRQWRQHFIIS